MEECPVCLESLKNSQTLTVDCCKKQFHVNCYVNAMSINPTCPLCRKDQVIINMPTPTPPPTRIILVEPPTVGVRKMIITAGTIFFICGVFGFIFNQQ